MHLQIHNHAQTYIHIHIHTYVYIYILYIEDYIHIWRETLDSSLVVSNCVASYSYHGSMPTFTHTYFLYTSIEHVFMKWTLKDQKKKYEMLAAKCRQLVGFAAKSSGARQKVLSSYVNKKRLV